jgi:hypothetical protein
MEIPQMLISAEQGVLKNVVRVFMISKDPLYPPPQRWSMATAQFGECAMISALRRRDQLNFASGVIPAFPVFHFA